MISSALSENRCSEITAGEFIDVLFSPDDMPSSEVVCISRKKTVFKGKSHFRNHSLSDRVLARIPTANEEYYFCASSVQAQGCNDKYLCRGRAQTRSAYVLGLDDIGTKAIEPSVSPTYKIETSPGNFQWGYVIAPYELDGPDGEKTKHYEACVQGCIDAGLSDSGAVGCYRLWRVPGSINKKPENGGFRARITFWAPDRIWQLDELMKELGISPSYRKGASKVKEEMRVIQELDLKANPEIQNDVVLVWLQKKGLLLKSSQDFYTITCPWAHEHTDGQVTAQYSPIGAGGAEYADSRQFHCFHAHCAERNIDNFLEWLREKGGPDVSTQGDISLSGALKKITALMESDDHGIWFEADTLEALKAIKNLSVADYHRVRSQLKQKRGISVTELEKELLKIGDMPDVKLTHYGIAKALLADLFVEDKAQPVSCFGNLFRCQENIWTPFCPKEISSYVAASRYDGESVCRLGAQYKSIAELMLNISYSQDYFLAAPKGVAAGGYFYRITNQGEIEREILGADHRCRFSLPKKPKKTLTPIFSKLLETAFMSDSPEETTQQIALLQEVFGGILLGLIAPLHKAVVFYGASRAGKGVLVDIIQSMLPNEAISAVSPFEWGKEYHIAAMAGKRLNLCGEFPEDNQLPAAVFKQVIGGDPVSGRVPCQEVFTFTVDASQVFSCNYLPYCREQSDSFYNRWQVVHFPNTVPEKERNPNLAEIIIKTELPGILNWALEGAARLIKQERFTNSIPHNRVMDEWRLRSDSVAAFVATKGIQLLKDYQRDNNRGMPTADFYDEYESYCDAERIKPAGKKTCYERLRSIKGVRIKHFEDGDKVVLL